MTSELRSWFLRNVLEATERLQGSAAVTGLRARLPPRLSPHASLERLRASGALDTVPLEEGEEILLSLDSMLGDGSGRLLESIGFDLATRVLTQGGGVARAGDLVGTVARLQAFLEHPFVGVPLVFELKRSASGFSLTVGVTGHSRATRALRHLTAGAIVAAERFAREAGAENLKLYGENIADRATIHARYLIEELVSQEAVPASRRPPTMRHSVTSLSDEVERILRSSSPPRPRPDPSQPAAQVPDSRRAPNSLKRTPQISHPEIEDAMPPESTTYRLRNASVSRSPAGKKPGETDLG